MPSLRWSVLLLAVVLLAQAAMTTPVTSQQEAEPAPSDEVGQLSEQVFGPELHDRGDREKRKILEIGVVSGLGVKNYLMNLIFGGRKGPAPRPTTTTTTTTESVPEFNRDAVSLDIPGEVFGSGFTILNNVAKIVGDVVQNSAYRTQRLFEALKPYLGSKFGIDTTTSIRKSKSAVEDNLVR